MYVNIKEGDIGGEDGLGKSDRIATIEMLKKKEKGIMSESLQQEDIISEKVRFSLLSSGSPPPGIS